MEGIAGAVKDAKISAEAFAEKVEDAADDVADAADDVARDLKQTALHGHEEFDAEESKAPNRMEWRLFEATIRIAIVVNVAYLGLQEIYPENKPVWYVLEHVFTTLFTLEMCVKLMVDGKLYFCDAWNLFDFFICWVCIIDTWVLALAGLNESFNQLSAARFFRLLRILRAFRILKLNQQLNLIAASLSSSLKALVWIFVLMVMVIYTSSLFMMAAVERQFYRLDEFDVDLFFGSLGQSMLTMFNICIAAQWVEVAQPLFQKQLHVFYFLIIYLFGTTFAILNLVIGVIAERTMSAQVAFDEGQEETRKHSLMRNILVMVDAIFDDDQDGGVEMQEMEDIVYARNDLKDLLMTCGLPRGFNIRDLHMIFNENRMTSRDTVDKEEFITGMFRLIFNNEFQRDCCTLLTVAQVKADVQNVVKEIKHELEVHMDRLFIKTGPMSRDKLGEHAASKDSADPISPDQAVIEVRETAVPQLIRSSAAYTTIKDVGAQLEHVSAAIKVMGDAQKETQRLLEAQLHGLQLAAQDSGSANADLVNLLRGWPRTQRTTEATKTLDHSFDSTGGAQQANANCMAADPSVAQSWSQSAQRLVCAQSLAQGTGTTS